MKYERVIGIGDIHGCVHTLDALLGQLQPTENDLLVFTGDYVDRGLYSFDVIERLIGLKEQFPQTIFIKGNHEDLFMKHLDGDLQHRHLFFYNGGWQTVNSYDEATCVKPYAWEDMPANHIDFLRNLKVIHVEETDREKFVFVHGGLRPGFTIEQQQEHDIIWIRDTFLNERVYSWGATIVHGHTPMEEKELEDYHKRYRNKINLDSGAVFGYELTAVNVLTREEWTQPLIKTDTHRGVH